MPGWVWWSPTTRTSPARLQLRIGIRLDRTWHEIEEVSGDPGSAQFDEGGWVITDPWTNDEWQQWVAPVRRQDT